MVSGINGKINKNKMEHIIIWIAVLDRRGCLELQRGQVVIRNNDEKKQEIEKKRGTL